MFSGRCRYRRFNALPPKSAWRPGPRPAPSTWRKHAESPVYKNDNILRSYQLDGLNWLTYCWYNRRSSMLADEMGLGKTAQTVVTIQHLVDVGFRGPFLIVAPLSTLPHWQREFEGWTDLNVVLNHGDVESRRIIRQYEWQYDGVKVGPSAWPWLSCGPRKRSHRAMFLLSSGCGRASRTSSSSRR